MDEPKPPPKGQAVLDHLAATGTGEVKLTLARAHVAACPASGLPEVLEKLVEGGCGPVTVAKACKFLEVPVPSPAATTGRPEFPVRAPVGGCKVGEDDYAAGQVIPKAVVDATTGDELKALLADTMPTLKPVKVPAAPKK